MSQSVNQATIDLIKRNEGCVLHAYQDSVGIWTIGYGHTGSEVTPRLVWTQEQADAALRTDLKMFEDEVDALVTNDATTEDQFGAMVSLCYNIGPGNFHKSSVLRLHNAGRTLLAADAFLMWDKAGGQVLKGLVRRRKEERALYLT